MSGAPGWDSPLTGASRRRAGRRTWRGRCCARAFPPAWIAAARAVRGFVEQVQRFKKIRMLGSAALALAYVASGRADAYYEESIKLWDIAAGLALVEAAGGHVRVEPGTGSPLAFNVWAVGGRNSPLRRPAGRGLTASGLKR